MKTTKEPVTRANRLERFLAGSAETIECLESYKDQLYLENGYRESDLQRTIVRTIGDLRSMRVKLESYDR